MSDQDAQATVSRLLTSAEDAAPVDAVTAVTRELGLALGATEVSFLITDTSGRALVRLAHISFSGAGDEVTVPGAAVSSRRAGRESASSVPLYGPVAQALRSQEVQVLPPGHPGAGGLPSLRWTVLAPVTERGEVLGLLEMSLPVRPGPAVVADIAATAHALAFVVIANRRHTDLFEWGQRSTAFTLSAEIQRRLLPGAFTCEGGSFTLSAWLEPTASVGGDTFDYSAARDELHLSVTDAMGHGVAAALTATLCVGSLRNSRHLGATLIEQAHAANSALLEHKTSTDGEGFATGLLGRLDLPSGSLALLNAGHVAPFLARSGTVSVVELAPALPLGMFPNPTYTTTELALQPGDRLVIVTDGMLERNAAGLDLPAAVTFSLHLHPREATRYLADQVLAVTGDTLSDDATLLMLDWHGQHGTPRSTTAGADWTNK